MSWSDKLLSENRGITGEEEGGDDYFVSAEIIEHTTSFLKSVHWKRT